jgi:vacuolar-type H+-ATPase subunit D/Vma8|tara:strand:- start:923 stop:1174 length:252 start_codon:yes stop_codon:yes gene_type:complete
MNKIKEEQLERIQNQQQQLNDTIREIGLLESKKHGLLHNIAAINSEVEELKEELEKEYGRVNINIETGEYTEMEQEQELSKIE